MYDQDKLRFVEVHYSFYILLNLICQYFINDFSIKIHEKYWSLCLFYYQGNNKLIKWVGKCLPLFYFLEEIYRIFNLFSIIHMVNFHCSTFLLSIPFSYWVHLPCILFLYISVLKFLFIHIFYCFSTLKNFHLFQECSWLHVWAILW